MKRRSANRRRKRRAVVLRMVTLVLFTSAAAALVIAGIVALLPLPASVLPEASHIYDHTGNQVTQLFEERRTPITIDRMPTDLLRAVVAVEDERFYRHFGLDAVSLVRAAIRNLQAGRIVEGGSTITQQLAKNTFLTHERTFRRKLTELTLTLRLEQRLTKTEILEGYMNTIYWGHGAYGVEEAALTYFGRSAETLNLAESALLAGLIRSPERLSPHRDLTVAVERQQTVLRLMVDSGVISQSEADEARAAQIELGPPRRTGRYAPYFVQLVMDEVAAVIPGSEGLLYRGGLRIHTTLDRDAQAAAENAAAGLPAGTPDHRGVTQPQVAVVGLDPATGGIRALVGGRDFAETQFNRAVQARRQPGSAFKPILYLAALDSGYAATARQVCEPVSFPGGQPGEVYTPTDHGRAPYHYRPMAMREALAISDNVVAVRWMHVIGPQTAIQYARAVGIDSPLEPHLALALGTSEVTPLELTAAYAAIANGGSRIRPHTVTEIRSASGELLYRRTPESVRVVRPEVAYLLTDLLTSVMKRGGTGATIGTALARPAAGKTGTTENMLDAWFIGYTPDLVAAVYVGYDGPRHPLPGMGATIAGPVWLRFMSEALSGRPARAFEQPSRVRRLSVCSETGMIPNVTCPTTGEVFASPLVPIMSCPLVHDRIPFSDEHEITPSPEKPPESEAGF